MSKTKTIKPTMTLEDRKKLLKEVNQRVKERQTVEAVSESRTMGHEPDRISRHRSENSDASALLAAMIGKSRQRGDSDEDY